MDTALYRIILVDDHEDSLDILQFYIDKLPNFEIVDKCRNGEELIDSIMRTNPDVILTDIHMPVLNGVDAIRACLKMKSDLLFIFITSYEQYAVEAFELSAVDYVVKPIEKARLYAALEKVKKTMRLQRAEVDMPLNLLLKNGNEYNYIPVQDIIFIEKQHKRCLVYTQDKVYSTNEKISELLNQLPHHLFFMSHRSYIVNLSKIARITAKNQTYHAYFRSTFKYAHVSKLKITELQARLSRLM